MNFKNFENKRGITLIALVITIIVLLILAGITINLTIGQDGIITTAQQAGRNYTQAYENEQAQLDELNSDVDELISSLTSEKKVDRTGLKVGDYIDYTPDTAEGTTYSASLLAEAITGSTNNTSDLTMDTLKWQILRIYDDGSMDLIGDLTSKFIYFQGALGYNNGVYVMNDICKTLYSRTSAGITARSVNIEDIEYWLQKDAEGKTVKDKFISINNTAFGDTQTYEGSKSKYPTLWARQTGATITTSSGTTVTTGGISESNDGYESATDETYLPQSPTSSDSITVKQTYWESGEEHSLDETNFGAGSKALYSPVTYWVASRDVACAANWACFGLRFAGNRVYGTGMFYSDTGNANSSSNSYLRPVITLGTSAKIDASETASNLDGTPHHIVSY